MQLFAKELGVRYEYVQTNWNDVIGDLTGRKIRYKPSVQEVGSRPIRGDVIANGMTIPAPAPEAARLLRPHLPSAVWLLARPTSRSRRSSPAAAGSRTSRPPRPGWRRHHLRDGQLLPRPDPLRSRGKGLKLKRFTGSTNINDVVPAMLKRESDMTSSTCPTCWWPSNCGRARSR